MRAEKHLNRLRITYLNLKSLRFSYFVPIIALFLYIPAMTYLYFVTYACPKDTLQFFTALEMQHMIPYFSIWWILFGLREYTEGAGRELLKTYKKSLLPDFFLIFFWYMLHALLVTACISMVIGSLFMDYLLVLLQAFVFSSCAFLLMIVCRTISIPLLICTIYEIFFIFANYEPLQGVNLLTMDRITELQNLVFPYLPLFAASLLLILAGNRIFKKAAYK